MSVSNQRGNRRALLEIKGEKEREVKRTAKAPQTLRNREIL